MDVYQIMGFNGHVSLKEVKVRYRDLAKKWHPDVNKQAGAEEKFKHISNAYQEILRLERLGIAHNYTAPPRANPTPQPKTSSPPRRPDLRPKADQVIFRVFPKYNPNKPYIVIDYPDSIVYAKTRFFIMLGFEELSFYFDEDKDLPLTINIQLQQGPLEVKIIGS